MESRCSLKSNFLNPILGILFCLGFQILLGQASTVVSFPAESDTEIVKLQQEVNVLLAVDKKVEAYQVLALISKRYEQKMDYQSVLFYLQQQQSLGKQLNDIPKEINPLITRMDIQASLFTNDSTLVQNAKYAQKFVDNEALSAYNRSLILIILADIHIGMSQADSAIFFTKKAINNLKGQEDHYDSYIVNKSKLANYYRFNKRYRESMELLMEIERLLDEKKVTDLTRQFIYLQLGQLFNRIEDYEKARSYFLIANQISKRNNFRFREASEQLYLGEIALNLNELSKGEALLKKSISYMQKSPLKRGLSRAFIGMATAYSIKEEIELSKAFLDSASYYLSYDPSEREENNLRRGYANYWIKKGNFENAKRSLVALTQESAEQQKLWSKYYKNAGNYEASNASLEKYIALRDSSDRANQALKVHGMEVEFRRKQQATEIDALTTTTNAQKKSLVLKNIALVVGGGLLLIFTGLLYTLFGLNRKNKQHRIALAKNNKVISKALAQNNLLLQEIHHRVKNNLQVISSLLSMQARKVTDKETKNALKSSKTRVQSMSLLHRNLYEGENLKTVNINNYLHQLLDNITTTYSIGDHVEFDFDIDPIAMDIDSMVPLGLISNEIICNAVKHAFVGKESGKLTVSLKEMNDDLILKIEDDGIGFQGDNLPIRAGSLGDRLIDSLIKRLDGKLTLSGLYGVKYKIVFNKNKLGLA